MEISKLDIMTYYLEHFLDSDHPDIIETLGEDSYLVQVAPSAPFSYPQRSELTNVWRQNAVIIGANCLAYGINRPDLGAAHPHILSPSIVEAHKKDPSINRETILRIAMDASGFKRVRLHETDRDKTHVVALAYSTTSPNDFHFYRLDKEGWSHKPGLKPVLNTDASGLPIQTPEDCDRFLYNAFLGYYVLPETGIKSVVDAPLSVNHLMR